MITVLSPKVRSRLAGRRYPSSLVGIRTRCPRCREIAPDQQSYFHGRGPTRICTPCVQELIDATDDERRSWNLPPLQSLTPGERYTRYLIERGLYQRGIPTRRSAPSEE